VSMWSKNGMPVLMELLPVPSILSLTAIRVSLVSRWIFAPRTFMPRNLNSRFGKDKAQSLEPCIRRPDGVATPSLSQGEGVLDRSVEWAQHGINLRFKHRGQVIGDESSRRSEALPWTDFSEIEIRDGCPVAGNHGHDRLRKASAQIVPLHHALGRRLAVRRYIMLIAPP